MLKRSTTLPPLTFETDVEEYISLGRKAERGNADRVMSRGELWDFAKCPRRWVEGRKEEKTDATDWGSLVDCLILTPERFEECYSICPETYPAKGKKKDDPSEEKEWNRNATFCKEWEAAELEKGKTCIKADQASEAWRAQKRFMRDEVLAAVLHNARKQVQVCVDYTDAATGIVVPIKCLLDVVPDGEGDFGSMLADLKTTFNAAPGSWSRAVFSDGYHYQAALYLDAFNVAANEKRNVFSHLVQESFAPYETARRMLSEEYLELGRLQYQRDLAEYCRCLATNKWPGFEDREGQTGQIIDGWRLVEPESWMILQ